MKLSNETVDVLKNFSNINQNILIKEGNTVRTMSTMKNILAQADISESFPKDFGVYDLNEFLGVLTLVSDAELEFENDSFLTVNGGHSKIKYFFSDPSILVTPPETFNAPECDVTFQVLKTTLANVLKASAVMQLPDIVMSKMEPETVIKISATDLKNVTSNSFSEQLEGDERGAFRLGYSFNFHFKVDNLKMISGDYDVSISSEALVSHWENSSKQIDYWIALEQPSD